MLDTHPGAEPCRRGHAEARLPWPQPTQASRGQFCGRRRVCETAEGGASVFWGQTLTLGRRGRLSMPQLPLLCEGSGATAPLGAV